MVKLKRKSASLDFPSYTFRYHDDLKGRGGQYLNVSPSAKAPKRERDKLHEMTGYRQCYEPILELVEDLNRHLQGWADFFSFWLSSRPHREINS